MRILYDSKDLKFKSPFGTLKENESCNISIHIPKSCKTVGVKLILNEENGVESASFSLKKSGEYDGYDIYSCSFSIACAGLYFYYFSIKTENEHFSLFKYGYDMTNMEDGQLWQLSCIPKDFSVDESYFGRVMYQIFPDRFALSGKPNLENKLKPFVLHSNTSDVPCFLPDEQGVVQNNDFFGGNLNGIKEKLEYLKDLGVSLIYLNPIFKAYSNHRYDTADYKKIDEALGTEEDFIALCDKAHTLGMKIILDGVFSHTGSNSVYFDKENVFGNGAYSNPDSPYRDWFDFKEYPDNYTSWWGIETLPCVNELSEDFVNYIIEDEDSVIAHWLRAGADGFRLDVADELPDEFIAKLHRRVKEIKPDGLVIGEVWEDASNKSSYGARRKYFTARELDSVMNYPLRGAIINYINGNDGGFDLKSTVMTIAENYPKDVFYSLMNMVSTHDTPRILSVLGCANPPKEKWERAEYHMPPQMLEEATRKLMCASFIQFVLPGMPCIYYGDEIGTEGFEDPFCRTFFDWEKVQGNNILAHYKLLADLRNNSDELKIGNLEINTNNDGLIEIVRKHKTGVYRGYINNSDNVFSIDTTGLDVLYTNAQDNKNQLDLSNFSFVLLRENNL